MPTVDSLLSERQPYRSKRFLSHVRECCELCCLTAAIFLVVGLFAIPVSLHHLEIDDLVLSTTVPATEPSLPPSSNDSCPQRSINNITCPTYSWGRVNRSACTGVFYTGSVCRQNLDTWQQCSLGQAGNVRVNYPGNLMTEAEMNATTFTNLLNIVASESCRITAFPFICQYLFPLCDCNTGDVLLPSKEYCTRISTNDCQMEWSLAKQFGYGDLLPDCNTLPTTSNGTAPSGNSSSSNVTNNSTAGPCRESFLRINGTCQPICHLWEQTSRPWSIVLKTVNIISLSVGLISGIVVIVLSMIQYNEKLRFPSVSLVYFTIGVCIIAIAGLVGEAATEYFYCSSLSLITSIANPTVYCTVAGGILQFFLVNLSLWWLVHVYLLFHMVMWPSHRNVIERRHKWIHCLVFIIVTILSTPGVLLVILHQDYRYTIFNFPPLFCAPDDEVFFYSTTMVLDIVVAIGIIFIILALGLIHKNQGLFRTSKGNIVIRTSEKWQLIVLIYNAFFIIMVTVFTSLAGSSVSRRFVRAITSHFTCEALEYTPGKCDRADFEQYSTAWVFTVILVLLALIPVVSLVQAWDTEAMKQKCSRSRKRQP